MYIVVVVRFILYCIVPGQVPADHGINQDALMVHCCP